MIIENKSNENNKNLENLEPIKTSLLKHMYSFGPLIGEFTVPKNIIDYFLEEGKKVRQSKNDYTDNLAGHLKHEYYFNDNARQFFVENLDKEVKSYMDAYFNINNVVNKYIDGIGLYDLWINYMQAGDFNPPHIHAGSFSFVLFLDVPKELEPELMNNKGKTQPPGSLQFMYGEEQDLLTNKHTIMPKTGDFYIFPATLHHYVAPFKTNCERVSMSGNIKISIDNNRVKESKGFEEEYFNNINFVRID